MALDILTKGPSLDFIEDNQMHYSFKALMKRIQMQMTVMTLKKESQEFIYQCIRAWSGEKGHTHIEAVVLNDANRQKFTLDAYTGHCILRSNKIVAATAYKQLVQGALGLPEYVEKCKEVTAVCNIGIA